MRPKREVFLSSFLTEQTNIVGKSVSLQNKNITAMDAVSPFVCSEIQHLNLHKNKLTSLKNIQQFVFLKQLDISSNKIGKCSELACLRSMKISKIYVSDNPFLSEPLDQQILDFLLQRETDIEILSFEVLNSIREVQQDEIKIIFLKNYLSKIEMHEELKNKQYLRQPRSSFKTEQLVHKIIPQFYTIIEDPKMTRKIKSEALQLKNKKNASIQYALRSTKNAKMTKINQLIGDIVNLLHESGTFREERTFLLQVNYNQNSISFSPDKLKQARRDSQERSQQFSPVKYIELSKDNSLQQFSLVNSKHVGAEKTNVKERVQTTPATQHFSETNNKRTPPKGSFVEKPNNFSSFKQNYQSELKRIRERQSNSANNDEFLSVKMQSSVRPQTNQKNSSKQKVPLQTEFIKVIQYKDSSYSNKPEESIPKNEKSYQTPNQQSNFNRNSLMASRQSLAIETYQTIYLRSLSKTNPMFSLLFSPANSLTAEEKSTILQSLKIDHKQKSIELMKEKSTNQILARELEHLKADFNYKMENVISSSRCAFEEKNKLKEDYEWLHQRYRDLQNDYELVFGKLKEVENKDNMKTHTISVMEASYKKIKDSYKEKADELALWVSAEQKQEKIVERHCSFVKAAYLKLLKKKAAVWKRIFKAIAESTVREERRLKQIGIQSFRLCRQLGKHLEQMRKNRECAILRESFDCWVFFKKIERKERVLLVRLKNSRCASSIERIKGYEAFSKMKKLKNIWADRFRQQRLFSTSVVRWKDLMRKASDKYQKAVGLYKQKVLCCYFQSMKLLIGGRKQKIKMFGLRLLQRKRQSEFKRMINLIKKQQFQIQDRETRVEHLHEYTQRKTYLYKMKYETKSSKQIKQKLKVVKLKRKEIGIRELRQFTLISICFSQKKMHLFSFCRQRTAINKLKLIKHLQIYRLHGKNYVKYRTIQEMNTQMDHNDRTALQLVRFTQEEVDMYKRDIAHFKQIIITQQNRQKELILRNDSLLVEKDSLLIDNESLLISAKETMDVYDQLRAQFTSLNAQYVNQVQRNETLAKLYNELAGSSKERL